MAAMSFRTFMWPINPEKIEITFHRFTEVHPENGLWTVDNIARMPRVFSREGAFYGTTAYSMFSTLAQLFYDGTAGTLKLPNWSSANALLTDLTLLEEPAENFLRYRFSFLEVPGGT